MNIKTNSSIAVRTIRFVVDTVYGGITKRLGIPPIEFPDDKIYTAFIHRAGLKILKSRDIRLCYFQ